MYNNELLSKTITFLRLPLIVGVVFIHTQLADINTRDNYFVYGILRHVISDEFARIAVPLFYFISGFLFFNSEFSYSAYKNKLKKRIHTILYPYLFWNLVVLGLTYLNLYLFPSMTQEGMAVNKTFSGFFQSFYDRGDGMPICYQFWFIRDLMVVVLCSPLIYYFVCYFKIIGVFILGILWCFGMWPPIIGFSSVAFFFFTFGALFAIRKHNFVTDFIPLHFASTISYLLIIIIDTVLWYKKIDGFNFIHNIGIVVGMIMVVTWTAYAIEKGKMKCSALLAASSFFIYAYHVMPLKFVVKVYNKLMQPTTEMVMILGYILIPLFVVGVGIGIYIVMLRYMPRFTRFITGGR